MFTGEWDDPRSPRQQQRDAERELVPGKQVEMFPPAATASGLPAHETNGADAEHGKRSTDSTRDGARTKTPDVDDAQAEVARLHWTLYLALIQLCEEDAATVWIDPLYKGRYTAQIQATILECRTAGLTNEEIEAVKVAKDTKRL